MRLKLSDLPDSLQRQARAQLEPSGYTGQTSYGSDVVAGVSYTIPEPDAGEESLVVNEAEEAGQKRITVSIHRFGAKLLDADNLAGGCKPLLDALRYAKYIPDDNPRAIKLNVSQSVVAKAKRGVLIRISPT